MIKVRGSFRGPLTPVDRLCLRVKYGIDQSQLFFVKEDDLTRVDEQKWTFETKVRLTSSKTWSPAGKNINFHSLIMRHLTILLKVKISSNFISFLVTKLRSYSIIITPF